MNRREFLAASAATAAGAALAKCGCGTGAACACGPKCGCTPLNLCLQWWAIPAADDLNAKLDYLEKNGYKQVEIPTGDWLLTKAEALAKALEGRKLKVATACGGSDFSYADKARRDAEVAKFLPQLEKLGMLKSTGLIICPARGKPELSAQDLRESFVTDTGRRLAEKAAACGTAIVLEPLQRAETPFLRQVADGAKMAQEIGAGCTVMGDFWHMSKEEVSQSGAFLYAGKLLSHVHIASLKTRRVPGTDGAADDYVDGFRALKQMGYKGAVSLEAGWPVKNPDDAKKHEILTGMCSLIKKQWEEA